MLFLFLYLIDFEEEILFVFDFYQVVVRAFWI